MRKLLSAAYELHRLEHSTLAAKHRDSLLCRRKLVFGALALHRDHLSADLDVGHTQLEKHAELRDRPRRRKVEFFTPPFLDKNGFARGGVSSYFTELDSTLGSNIPVGAVVVPEFEYDPYSKREELTALNVVKESPYTKADFE